MLITLLPVPPACIRPSVSMGSSGSNEDDLTVKLCTFPLAALCTELLLAGDIVHINQFIKNAIAKGVQTPVASFSSDVLLTMRLQNLMEFWGVLQQQVAMLINSDLPGFP